MQQPLIPDPVKEVFRKFILKQAITYSKKGKFYKSSVAVHGF